MPASADAYRLPPEGEWHDDKGFAPASTVAVDETTATSAESAATAGAAAPCMVPLGGEGSSSESFVNPAEAVHGLMNYAGSARGILENDTCSSEAFLRRLQQ